MPNDQDRCQIEAWLTQLAAAHPATTVAAYRTAVTRAANDLPNGLQATGDELLAWVATLRGQLAHNTVSSYVTALRRFYGWCYHTERITVDLSVDLPAVAPIRGTPHPINEADLDVILTHAGAPHRLWMLIMAGAGLRCCDLAQLRREDIAPDVIHVRRSKGGKSRTIPTHPAIWAAVRDLPAGLICGGKTAKRVSDNIAKELDRLAHRLARRHLADITAHHFRHTCLTHVQRACGDIRVTQRVAGHSSLAATEIYTAVSDQTAAAAVTAVPIGPATGPAAGHGEHPPRWPSPPAALWSPTDDGDHHGLRRPRPRSVRRARPAPPPRPC